MNQKIKCDVTNCAYNNNLKNLCELSEISVSCSCSGCNCHKTAETICSSFKESDK